MLERGWKRVGKGLKRGWKGVKKVSERCWKGIEKELERSWKGVGKGLEKSWKRLERSWKVSVKGLGRGWKRIKKRINFKGERQMAEALMAGSRNIPRNQQKLSKVCMRRGGHSFYSRIFRILT